MKEKKDDKELNNFEDFLKDFQKITKEDLIPKNNTNLQKLHKMNIISLNSLDKSLIQQKTFIEPKINSERKNSTDKIDRNQIKRILMKKKTQYFKNDDIIKEEKELNIEELKDFRTECILYDSSKKTYIGKLFIDQSYTICFSPELNNKPLYFKNDFYIFPLLSIWQCNNNSNYFGQSKYCKEITLKDGRNFVFKFTKNAFKDFSDIIEKYAFPEKNENFFNFAYLYKNSQKNENKNIKIYNFFEEFKRQGIIFSSQSNNDFRVLKNVNYELCESYPKKIIVPNSMTNDEIKKCAEFRTKNRLPTLTYRHYKNGACIWRSSQTKTGLKNYSNKSDIKLLNFIANNKKLYIYDARPYLNAMANKLKGAGFENINNYPDIDLDLIFCGIPNIHSVRNAYQKLLENVSYNTTTDTTLFYNISNSYWYEYIIILIKSSFQIFESIKIKKSNVLIHCSDGWDRTSQLCALSQILLDKYYRTLNGFICLIEKDWLSFGHQFRYRNGFYSQMDTSINENQFSPIFLQWLDAVYQLMSQNYEKFEFNFDLILLLAEELYGGKYGTFMFNNDKERELFQEDKTCSLWNYIKENENKFINKLYDKDDDRFLEINYKNIKLWKDYFYRFELGKNEEYYYSIYDKKIKTLENKKTSDENIIEKMAKFIKHYCNNEEIEKLDDECKKIVLKFKEEEKKSDSI